MNDPGIMGEHVNRGGSQLGGLGGGELAFGGVDWVDGWEVVLKVEMLYRKKVS